MDIDLVIIKALLKRENYDKYRKYFDELFSDKKHPLAKVFSAVDALVIRQADQGWVSLSEESLSLQVAEENPFIKKADMDFLQGALQNLRQIGTDGWDFTKLLEKFKIKAVATKLAISAIDVAEGKADSSKLQSLFEELQSVPGSHPEEEDSAFVQGNLSYLLEKQTASGGLNWRLQCLRQSIGPLRKGDFGFLFARPETGKTTFLASEMSFFLDQTEAPILWFNNEEQGEKVYLRVMQAYFGISLAELKRNAGDYEKTWDGRGLPGKFRLYDDARLTRDNVTRVIEQLQPGCIIFDQIDKLKGFADYRNDLELGNIYIWAREMAKQYCPVIGVCQAGATAENKKYLTMDDVVNAKCLSPDTKVLMYNGDWRRIDSISVGEQVMGPDSSPRNVLSVSSGKEEMYKVTHKIGGDSYVVNKSHILCLIDQKGNYVNKNVLEYKNQDFGYRSPHDLPEIDFPIEPYYLGLWLGDGKASAPEITTMDPEIKEYIKWYSKCWGCEYVEWQNGENNPDLVQAKIKYRQGVKHPVMEALRSLGLENNKHIPEIYFKGSISQRLDLIAGLLDTDGTLAKRKHEYFLFSNKNKSLAEGLKKLCLSCGLMATLKERAEYFYVHISSNYLGIVPTRVKRKQSTWQSHKDVLKSRLEITPLGIGDYAGFVLDGDHQFIIEGNIVTHNTSKQAEADWILGIGALHEEPTIRYFNIPKNKLSGGPETDEIYRHGRFQTIIKPEVARYDDI